MPPEAEKGQAKPAAAPAGEKEAAAGAGGMNKILLGAVAVLGLWGAAAPFLFKGGGDHPPEDAAPAKPPAGADREADDPVPGPQILIPEMTFPMRSSREPEYPAFKIEAVLVLRGGGAVQDEEAAKRAADIEAAVEKSIPWIQGRIHDIIFRIPIEERDQILYEGGARQFEKELKDLVNQRFKGAFGEDVVKDVWLSTRRPVY